MDSSVMDDIRAAAEALEDLPPMLKLIEVHSLDQLAEIPAMADPGTGALPPAMFGVPVIVDPDLREGEWAITDVDGTRRTYPSWVVAG